MDNSTKQTSVKSREFFNPSDTQDCSTCSPFSMSQSRASSVFVSQDDEWKLIIQLYVKSTTPWVEKFIKESKKVTKKYKSKAKKFQKDFQLFIMTFSMKSQEFQGKNLVDNYADAIIKPMVNEMQQKQNKYKQYQKKLIKRGLDERRIMICQEIEQQIAQKDHPINAYKRLFTKIFVKQYNKYIKKEANENKQTMKLIEQIQNEKLHIQHDSTQNMMSINENDESLNHKSIKNMASNDISQYSDISLFQKACQEVKGFAELFIILINKFYFSQLEEGQNDLINLLEDFMRISCNLLLNEEIHNILLCLSRVDSLSLDKDLRSKYDILKDKNTQDFGIDKYFTLNDKSPIKLEIIKRVELYKSSEVIIQGSQLTQDPSQPRKEYQNLVYNNFEEIKQGQDENNPKQSLDRNITDENISPQILKDIKTKIAKKPYRKSIQFFKNVMLSNKSPLVKLIELQDIKEYIKKEILLFWDQITHQPNNIVERFNRDEYQSIFIYIIVNARIPDLISQFKVIDSFTSEYIRSAGDGSLISETFNMLESSIKWVQALDKNTLENDGGNLFQAVSKLRENLYGTAIHLTGTISYDPFRLGNYGSLLQGGGLCNVTSTFILI